MAEERIRIEGPPDSLEELRRELLDELGDEVDIQPISSAVAGELREPILTGLAITITVAVSPHMAIKTVGDVIQRYMGHLERMEELRIYREGGKQEISVADLQLDESSQ